MIKSYEEKEIVPDVPGDQEIAPDMLLPVLAQPTSILRIRQ